VTHAHDSPVSGSRLYYGGKCNMSRDRDNPSQVRFSLISIATCQKVWTSKERIKSREASRSRVDQVRW